MSKLNAGDVLRAGVAAGFAAYGGGGIAAAVFAGSTTLASTQMQKQAAARAKRKAAQMVYDRRTIVQASVYPRRVIYGADTVSGHLAFAGNTEEYGITYAWLVINLAGHEVQEIGDAIFGERLQAELDDYHQSAEVIYAYYGVVEARITIDGLSFSNASVAGLASDIDANANYSASADAIGRITITHSGGVQQVGITGAEYDFNPGDSSISIEQASVQQGSPAYQIWKYTGADTDGPLTPLIDAFPDDFSAADKGQGIAKAVVKLRQDHDAWPRGLENIRFKIKGKKVYDPRTTADAWSDNPALIVLDYLRAGFGFNASFTPQVDWSAAANVCDELVEIPTPQPADPPAFEKRYTCNGSFLLDESKWDVLDALCETMAGSVHLVADSWTPRVGIASLPVMSLSADDLSGTVQMQPKPALSALFNTVTGSYINPYADWQEVAIPEVSGAGYIAQDYGRTLSLQRDLMYTQSQYMAQRLQWILLRRHRQGIVVSTTLKPSASQLVPGDVVDVSLTEFGWDAKEFQIIDWDLNADWSVSVTMQEYAGSAYDATLEDLSDVDTAPDTTLTSPFVVPDPQNFTLESGNNVLQRIAGTVTPRLKASWDKTTNPYVLNGGFVQLRYRENTQLNWTYAPNLNPGADHAFIDGVNFAAGDIYDVEIRYVNSLGRPSNWVAQHDHQIAGKTEAPTDITEFYVSTSPDGTRVYSWDAVEDLDVIYGGGYRIKYLAGEQSQVNWNSMTVLHKQGSGTDQRYLLKENPWENNLLPAGLYTFCIKAVDSSGNESLAPRCVLQSLGDPRMGNDLQSLTPHLNGWQDVTIVGATVDADGCLTAAGNYSWDDLTSWDAWTDWNMNPSTTISAETRVQDLGAVMGAQLTYAMTGYHYATLTTYLRWSDDGITWTDYTDAALVDSFESRYWQAKVEATADGSVPLQICGWTVSIGVPECAETVTGNVCDWEGDQYQGWQVPVTKTFSNVSTISPTLINAGPDVLTEIANFNPPKLRVFNSAGEPQCAQVNVQVSGVCAAASVGTQGEGVVLEDYRFLASPVATVVESGGTYTATTTFTVLSDTGKTNYNLQLVSQDENDDTQTFLDVPVGVEQQITYSRPNEIRPYRATVHIYDPDTTQRVLSESTNLVYAPVTRSAQMSIRPDSHFTFREQVTVTALLDGTENSAFQLLKDGVSVQAWRSLGSAGMPLMYNYRVDQLADTTSTYQLFLAENETEGQAGNYLSVETITFAYTVCSPLNFTQWYLSTGVNGNGDGTASWSVGLKDTATDFYLKENGVVILNANYPGGTRGFSSGVGTSNFDAITNFDAEFTMQAVNGSDSVESLPWKFLNEPSYGITVTNATATADSAGFVTVTATINYYGLTVAPRYKIQKRKIGETNLLQVYPPMPEQSAELTGADPETGGNEQIQFIDNNTVLGHDYEYVIEVYQWDNDCGIYDSTYFSGTMPAVGVASTI